MLRSIMLIVAALSWKYQSVSAVCVVPDEIKTRIFDTIAHYQGNKIPFNPASRGWLGSNVEFSFQSIHTLSKNSFITKDSEFIRRIKLSGKQIKEVDEGAFISLTCLDELLLDHNNITQLNRVFQGLEALQKLDLSHNRLESLKDLTFSELPTLKSLNLETNRIKTIEMMAFTNLTSLEYLNLEDNEIGKIPDELFHPLLNLTRLRLSWNKLGNIQPEKWTGLSRLQNLEVAGNNLKYFDPSYNFSFSSLKSLNLSYNALTTLNVVQIKNHLSLLELIDLNNNPWFCEDLEAILRVLYFNSSIQVVSSNRSNVVGRGIACNKVKDYSSTTTEVLASTSKIQAWVGRDEFERYMEKKNADNEKIERSVESLRTLVICVFGLLCFLILVELAYRTNIYGLLNKKLRRNNDVFIDDSADLENFRLLHR